MYDPKIGRWTTEDPLGFLAHDPNLFRYVVNCPLAYVDPNGELWHAIGMGLVGAAAGGITGWISGGWQGALAGAVGGGTTGFLMGIGVPPPLAGAAGGFLTGAIGVALKPGEHTPVSAATTILLQTGMGSLAGWLSVKFDPFTSGPNAGTNSYFGAGVTGGIEGWGNWLGKKIIGCARALGGANEGPGQHNQQLEKGIQDIP